MVTPQEKAQSVSWFIETKSDVLTQRRCRLSMETIHHQSLQFVDSKGNLWTRVRVECSEKWGTKNIGGKHRECKTIVQSFSYEAYPYCYQRIETTTYNSAQGSAKKVIMICIFVAFALSNFFRSFRCKPYDVKYRCTPSA